MRVKISLPEKFLFSTKIEVQIGDINYGNHLANDAVLKLIHESRIRFLSSLGLSEFDVGGASLILADVQIKYINQSFWGDILTFNISIDYFSACGFSIITQILNEQKNQEIARVRTNMVCFNYQNKIIQKVPETFIKLVKK